jgi:IPT/TIG domain
VETAAPFLLEGRIRPEGRGGTGVPGLRVEIRTSEEGKGAAMLGSAYTGADGRFSVTVADPALLTRRTVPGEISVFDRDGVLLHRRGVRVEPRVRRGTTEIRIPRDALTHHLAEPILLTPGTPLDPDSLVASFESVVRAAFGPADFVDTLLLNVRCPLPSTRFLTELGREAFGVLSGDPRAVELFATLANELGPPPESFAADVGLRDGCGCGGGTADAPSPYAGAADDPFLPTDAALPILAAAAHLQASGLFGDDLLVRTLRPLCRLEAIGRVHRLALGADGPEALKGRLGALLSPFGPIPECPPPPPIPEFTPPCERLIACGNSALEEFGGVRSYEITSVSTAVACPGDVITITGVGFGSTPGRVSFGGIEATATTWSDTSITVTVPQGARNPLSLVLPKYQRLICGRLVEATPLGSVTASFEVGAPEILAFFVDSPGNRTYCVEPGARIPLTWRVQGATNVRVEVLNAQGQSLFTSDPAPRHGIAAQLTAPLTNWTLKLKARITASGRCGPDVRDEFDIFVTRQPQLRIDGIEVTQAVQHYRASQHLTDPADRGPDNSLRLVTNKTAWVRAYLRSGLDPSFDFGVISEVDGSLTVERRVGGSWNFVATIPSQNGPMPAVAAPVSYDAERGNIDRSLNFVVPAALMTGLLRFTVDISVDRPCQRDAASDSVIVDVNLQQTLNAAFITIGYAGPDATGSTSQIALNAPTAAQCLAETAWTMTTYPVSGAPTVRVAGTFTATLPIDDARSCPGCCSPNWTPLLTTVAALVAADQAANPGNWVYYGLINGGIPVNVPGCNGIATGGLQGQPITYAHEIGHQFGLPHARCGNAGAGNAMYPVYEPYDLPMDIPATPIGNTTWTMASTGEYGLDINNGNISNPNDAEDFMSYCGPRWISVFTHRFLVNRAGLTPQPIATGSGAAGERVVTDEESGFDTGEEAIRPLIHILGQVGADGAVDIASVARLETRYLVGNGEPSDLRAQLVDEDGILLADDVVHRYAGSGCCADCSEGASSEEGPSASYMLKAMLDDVAPGQTLRIVRGDEVVWMRTRPDAAPKLSEVQAEVSEDAVRISWSCVRTVEDVSESWLRWSSDRGKTWNALTIVSESDSVEVPMDLLPAGSIRFQVLAHDGFSTAAAASKPVTISELPPAVSILYPRESDRVYAERYLHLRGVATRPGRPAFDDDAYVWHLDDREVGRGSDIWVETPSAGRHGVRLEVRDGETVGDASSRFVVRAPSREPGEE